MDYLGNRTIHLFLLVIVGLCVVVSLVIAGSDGDEQTVTISEDGLYYDLDTNKSTAVISGYVDGSTVAKIKLSVDHDDKKYVVCGISDDALFRFDGSDFNAYDGKLDVELKISNSSEGKSQRYEDALGNKYALVENVLGTNDKKYSVWYLESFGPFNVAVVCTNAGIEINGVMENHRIAFGESYYTTKIVKIDSTVKKTSVPEVDNAYVASFFGSFVDVKSGTFNFGNVKKMAIAGQYELSNYKLKNSDNYVSAYLAYSYCSYGKINPLNAPNLEVLWINGGMLEGLRIPDSTGNYIGMFEKCGNLNTLYLGKDAAFSSDRSSSYTIRSNPLYVASFFSSTTASEGKSVNIYPQDFFNEEKCSIRQIYVDPNNLYYESDDHYNVVKKGEDSTVIWESTAYDVTGTEEKDGSRIIVCIDIEQNFDFVEDPHLMITTSYDIPGYDGAFNNNLFIPIESVMAADGSRNKEESGHMLTFSFTSASYAGIFVAVVDGIPAEGEVINYFGCWQTNEEQP